MAANVDTLSRVEEPNPIDPRSGGNPHPSALPPISRGLRIVFLVGLIGLGVFGIVLWDPFEPRFDGRRDSEVVYGELFGSGGGPAGGFTVLEVMGRERYARGLVKLYRRYHPSLGCTVRNTLRNEWFYRFVGRWPKLDYRILVWSTSGSEPDISDVRDRVVTQIRHVGPAAAPLVADLVARLQVPTPDMEAIRALGAIGPAAAPALPSLREIAGRERNPRRLGRMSETLNQIDRGSWSAVVPAVRTCLSSPEDRTRAEMATLVGEMGLQASVFIADLEHLGADPSASVRAAAERSLKALRDVPGK